VIIEFEDGFPYSIGEHPDLAPGGVDAPSPPQSTAGGSTAQALTALDSLCAENADLRTRLAKAEQARDTAQAQLAHYNRNGW
jgi:hypothetical protein